MKALAPTLKLIFGLSFGAGGAAIGFAFSPYAAASVAGPIVEAGQNYIGLAVGWIMFVGSTVAGFGVGAVAGWRLGGEIAELVVRFSR